jgi:hypothetical protein
MAFRQIDQKKRAYSNKTKVKCPHCKQEFHTDLFKCKNNTEKRYYKRGFGLEGVNTTVKDGHGFNKDEVHTKRTRDKKQVTKTGTKKVFI